MRTLSKLAALAAVTISAPAAAQTPVGDWLGTLDFGQGTLRVVVHIEQSADGTLTGTTDSPDQGGYGIPIAGVSTEPDTLAFSVPALDANYVGKWDVAANEWKGALTQRGQSLPLNFGPGPPPMRLPADWHAPDDSVIADVIQSRVAARPGQGMVVGVLEPESRRIVAGAGPGAAAFDGNTVFEIGSISKVFTALLLADMAAKGELSLDDPAEKFLPHGAHLPERGRKITLRDLSMHRSGLPRLPDNMPAADPEDPYADYTVEQMLEFVGRYGLTRDVGARSEYSNLGVGLLGYLLTLASGKDYETLLRERITEPLGMTDTAITLPPELQARLAQPYDPFMRPAKPWRLPTLVGAGGIRSTANDMLKFTAAVLDSNSLLAPAMQLALAERIETGSPRTEQALGWAVVHPEPGRDLLFHNGGTGGFRAGLVIEPAQRSAVVVLTNSAAEPATDDIAMHLISGAPVLPTPPVPPAPPPPPPHTEVTLPVAELDRVVGRYDIAGRVFAFTRNDNGLWAEPTGLPKARVYAEAPLRFFWRGLDAHIRFTTDDAGKITGGEFYNSGVTQPVKRLDP
jgi:serine-type D-Ala-D-Ala carboxypeptidase/endopeptidase